jgi:hypothetical protein
MTSRETAAKSSEPMAAGAVVVVMNVSDSMLLRNIRDCVMRPSVLHDYGSGRSCRESKV